MNEKNTKNDQSVEAKPVAEKNHVIHVIMGMIMVAIYLAMAILLVFTPLFVGKMPEWVRYVMGVVFFVYGIFRAHRIYKIR